MAIRTRDSWVGLLLMCLAFFCFYDVLPLGFFSDDYYVLHRLTIDKQFWAPGFFRPFSDLLLLLNYRLSGYNALDYRLVNVLLHGLNAFVLYKTFYKVFELDEGKKFIAAFVAALLFVTYSSHSESVTWIVGRGSLIANLFGILCVWFYFSDLAPRRKIWLICIFYFIGLTFYESVLVLPGMLFFAAWYRKDVKAAFLFVLPLCVTLGAHIVVRLYASGVLAGRYGGDMFNEHQRNYASKALKSFGRLFTPGMHSSPLLIASFAGVFVLVFLSFLAVYKLQKRYFNQYLLLWIFLLIAQILPAMMGVDTHTSDGDRLLYFPSSFLCAIAGYFICIVTRRTASVLGVTLLIMVLNVVLLKRTNQNWVKADAAISNVFTTIKSTCCNRQVYVVNMPDAIEGSFVFRNGFYEALAVRQLPKENVHVVNYLLNSSAILQADIIVAEKRRDGRYEIPPFVSVDSNEIWVDSIGQNSANLRVIKRAPDAIILYWNRHSLVQLPAE